MQKKGKRMLIKCHKTHNPDKKSAKKVLLAKKSPSTRQIAKKGNWECAAKSEKNKKQQQIM